MRNRVKTSGIMGLLFFALTLCGLQGREFRVRDFGANADSPNPATAAIQNAIDAAAAAGGGDVTFERGTYRIGAIFLKSNVRLHVDEGVVLSAIQEDALYPERPTRVAGIEMAWPSAVVNVYQQTNVAIVGKGTIDGNGEFWWHKFWGKDGKAGMLKDYQDKGLRWAVDYDCKRVRALAIYDSSKVRVQGLTIRRSGFWSLTMTYSTDIEVDGVIVRANIDGFGPSSDGINIDSSRDILVENCDVDCNDDNFCLKAGRDWDGLRVNRPTENVVIRNCITRAGHGMLTIGSETSGGIRNIVVSNLTALGTSSGVRFKSARVRGGLVENIDICGLNMVNVEKPFEFQLNWYPAYSYPTLPQDLDATKMPPHWQVLARRVEPAERGIPEFRNIRISEVKATGAKQALFSNAFPEKPIRNVHFEKVRVEADSAGELAYANDWTLKDFVIYAASSEPLRLRNCANIESPVILSFGGASARPVRQVSTTSPFKLGMANPAEGGDESADHPTLFLIGDSTVKNGTKGQKGWGEVISNHFDTNRIKVANRALGGRSSRSFLTEGLWDKVLAEMKPGDFVLIQFGHNDGGPMDSGRARASLKGVGDDTRVVTNQTTKVVETVHSYGWYLEKYVNDAKQRGATPVLLSLVPRNMWKDGKVIRQSDSYAGWAQQVARETNTPFIDLNSIIAERYESMGEESVNKLFEGDHTHTNPEGALLNASIVANAIAKITDLPLSRYLRPVPKTASAWSRELSTPAIPRRTS